MGQGGRAKEGSYCQREKEDGEQDKALKKEGEEKMVGKLFWGRWKGKIEWQVRGGMRGW